MSTSDVLIIKIKAKKLSQCFVVGKPLFYQLAGRLTDADVLVLVPFFLRTVPVESLLSESDRLILLFDDGLCIPAALSLSSCNY